MNIVLGILIPFIGTTLGAIIVYFFKNEINHKFEQFLLGFASGVMIAASVWSLLLPAIDLASNLGRLSFLPPAIGFLLGVFCLVFIHHLTDPYFQAKEGKEKKSFLLFLAVTLHNIPEGMAVGIVFAGFLAGNSTITLAGCFTLAIGIALQNIPEGAIISLPLKQLGFSKTKSFLYGVISGLVEPIGALITICLTKFISPLMPYLLAFAAGAMIYVVSEELIPDIHDKNKSILGIAGIAFGFTLMMILDVALG